MGPDLGNNWHGGLKILFTSITQERANGSMHPLALKDGEAEKEPQLLARATQITYYALKQIPEPLEKYGTLYISVSC